MADDRRRRFSQIERPRGAGAEPPAGGPAAGPRFGALEEAAPPAPPAPVSPVHTDRFRPAAERPLEVEDRGEASQPFVRCARCETDSSRYAARCTTCGEPLDTDEQRAFNARLWAERRAVEEAEAADRAGREAALDQAREEAAAARRAMAESLAREVGERERRRLDGASFGEPTFGPSGDGGGTWGQGRWGDGGLGGGLPPGLRLLQALPAPWGVVAGVAAVALAAGLYLLRPVAGLVAGMILISLLTPGGWRWRRRRWW